MSYLTNQIAVQGKLIKKVVNRGLTKDGREFISIELILRTSETEEHTFRMYSNKLTKDGEISKIYEALNTVSEEYKSAEENGLDEADSVLIKNGEISMNRYVDRMGELRESRRLSARFCERLIGEYEPRAEFILVGVVENVVPKMNQEEEIELLKVNLIVPKGYNNLIDKVSITVRNTEFFDYIDENFSKGVVVRLGGNIINRVEKTVEQSPTTGFGQIPKLVEKTTRVSELLASGGDVLIGVEDTEFFTEEEIAKGLEIFNQSIEELKSTKPVEQVSIAPTGFGSVAPNPFGNTPTNPYENKIGQSMPNF